MLPLTRWLAPALLLVLLPLLSLAQDVEGAKDHPLLTRLPGFVINEYGKAFDEAEIRLSPDNNQRVEGTKTSIGYAYNEESRKPIPSRLQIKRNYENALAKLGGKVVFQDNDGATYKLTRNGKATWVVVDGFYEGMTESQITAYRLTVLEVEGMRQDITANAIYDALASAGFIALQINFDTGKSTIKPESQPIVDQIAQMLKDHPDLKVSVEGHTDNVGQPAANKTLSGQRAAAVVQALKGKGIGVARLSSTGWGQEKPVADNRTEDGRAQNRRVEIVKKS